MEIIYKGQTIQFTIEYRKRKSMQMKIDPAGRIHVNAPKGSAEQAILQWVRGKGDWILKQKGQGDVVKAVPQADRILYLGKYYEAQELEDQEIKKSYISFENDRFVIGHPETGRTGREVLLRQFYHKACKRMVKKRVASYLKYFKVKPKQVEVEDSIKRWGCCDTDRKLRFHWRLVMAPVEVIDYVVVHELCHLVHMNHSKSFWTLLGKIMPDYKARSAWLEQNGHKMNP